MCRIDLLEGILIKFLDYMIVFKFNIDGLAETKK